jgi:hypothetical protein
MSLVLIVGLMDETLRTVVMTDVGGLVGPHTPRQNHGQLGVVFVKDSPIANPNPLVHRGGERRTSSGPKTRDIRIMVPAATHTLVMTASVEEMLTILGAFRET